MANENSNNIELQPQEPNLRIAAVWVCRDNPFTGSVEYMLIKRSENDPDYPGKFGLLTETGEPEDNNIAKTAARGVSEELKSSEVLEQIDLTRTQNFQKGKYIVQYQVFKIKVAYADQQDNTEAENTLWMNPNEMMRMYQANPDSFLPEMDKRIELLLNKNLNEP
jgi:hypothetical protein